MAIQNMLAKSSSGVSEIERRVLKAIPEWKKWTRQLKQVYVLLPVFGSSDKGIGEMCEEFGWDKKKLLDKIEEDQTFRLKLAQYRDTDSYPIFPGSKKTYIKKSHLDTALKMMANGYLEHMEPVSSRPEIKYFMENERQPGIVQDNGPAPEVDYSGDGLPEL